MKGTVKTLGLCTDRTGQQRFGKGARLADSRVSAGSCGFDRADWVICRAWPPLGCGPRGGRSLVDPQDPDRRVRCADVRLGCHGMLPSGSALLSTAP